MESPGIVHLLASPFKRGRLLHFKFVFFAVPQTIVGFVLGMIYFVRPLFLYYYSRFRGHPVPVLEISLWFGGFVLLNIVIMIVLYRRSLFTWNKKEFSD